MNKILVYGMTSNNGGIEAYLINYYSHFKKGLKFDFITDYETIAWKEKIEALGSKIYYIPSRRDGLFKHMRMLRSIVKNNGYDGVYFNLLSASGVFTVLSVKFLKGVKIIVHSHNDNVGNLRVHKLLRPLLNCISDYKLACSDNAGKFMFSEKEYDKGNITIINNAINISKYKFDQTVREQVRKEFDLKDCFVVGHVGRMCYQKNSEFIIDIFNEIVKIEPNSKLLYVGTGEDFEKVQSKVKEYRLSDKVIFTGMRNDVNRLYMGMDAFLLPSRFEGLVIVAIEAQTAGLKCVVSSTVNKATKVTENIQFISLNEPPSIWADEIVKLKNVKRNDCSCEVRKAGYDIDFQSDKLESFFRGL